VPDSSVWRFPVVWWWSWWWILPVYVSIKIIYIIYI
jgi:hypothetical protein